MPSMRWSQWMVDGTAVVGRPEEMNCSTAICAVASCMATRSAPHVNSHRSVSSHCPVCKAWHSDAFCTALAVIDVELECRMRQAMLCNGYLGAI